MPCLDTDLVIAFLRGDPSAMAKVKHLRLAYAGWYDISITSITLCELYRGAFLSKSVSESIKFLNEFLESVTLLTQSKISCLIYGEDYAELKKNGIMTQDSDLMIASICKANNVVLLTRNVKDFKNIPDMAARINNW